MGPVFDAARGDVVEDAGERAALERWASARNVELVGVFEDRGVSGATALDRRPGLLAALDCMGAAKPCGLWDSNQPRLAERLAPDVDP